MEEKVIIAGEGVDLEGLFQSGGHKKGALITHPHPLYGGDMHNPVVETIASALYKHGYTTLRFNFRGVGASKGQYDDGIGEQQDVLSAAAFLRNRGIAPVMIGGYSFGAWVNANASTRLEGMKQMIMVSPPVDFMDFGDIKELPELSRVITGSLDEFASPGAVKKHISKWNKNATLKIIQGADHFYVGYEYDLETALSTL